MEEIVNLFPPDKDALKLEVIDELQLNPPILYIFREIIEDSFTLLSKFKNLKCFEASENRSDIKVDSKLGSKIEAVLSYVWENLHSGQWKDVNISWRYLYSYVSLFKVLFIVCQKKDFKSQALDAIKACDMGLIMGAPILDEILNIIADALNEKLMEQEDAKKPRLEKEVDCNVSKPPELDPVKTVEVYNKPSLETFLSSIMNKKPAIITGFMDHWPAMNEESRWSVDYLRKIAGFRTVPIEIGSKYTGSIQLYNYTILCNLIIYN